MPLPFGSSRLLPALVSLALVVPVPGSAQQRREASIPTDRIFEALEIREGATVCEMGAGDGDLTVAAAKLVGAQGRVYTSELGEERVTGLQKRMAGSELTHVTVVEGDPARTNFPDGACDALFMRNVYHHFDDPAAMNASIAAAVAPGGRVAIVDFLPRGSEARAPADRSEEGSHGVSAAAVADELKAAGFAIVDTMESSDRWFMVIASKPR